MAAVGDIGLKVQ